MQTVPRDFRFPQCIAEQLQLLYREKPDVMHISEADAWTSIQNQHGKTNTGKLCWCWHNLFGKDFHADAPQLANKRIALVKIAYSRFLLWT